MPERRSHVRAQPILFCKNGLMDSSAQVDPRRHSRDTWIVIPLYNEESVIGRVVAELREHFDHIVCIDDGSTDGSVVEAEAAGARVLRHPVNLGQGAAPAGANDVDDGKHGDRADGDAGLTRLGQLSSVGEI